MKHLLPFTLAALAVVSLTGCVTAPKSNDYTFARAEGGPDCRRFAQPGDSKIQIYCKQSRPDTIWPIAPTSNSVQLSGDKSCRRIAKSITGTVRTYCDTTAYWNDYDARAIEAGVTCRWLGYSHALSRAAQEVCLDGNRWVRAEASHRSRPVDSGGGWSGYSAPAGYNPPYATSYGPFPAGGAIGQ